MTTVDVPTAVHIGADELAVRRHRRWLQAEGDSSEGGRGPLDRGERVPGQLRGAASQAHRAGLRLHNVRGVEVQGVRLREPCSSFLYEPAGSVHTLQVLEDDTHVWFQIYGANLNLDADGNIESVVDGALTLAAYLMLCEAAGLPRPNVLLG